jgi:signal transduction histidine kinase/phage shock protein PspC (stress-responsive transcriptional regulator)
MLTGVVAGIAERLEVDPFVARLLVILLALAGGLGVIGYMLAWAVSAEPDERATVPPVSLRRTVAVSCVTAGVLLVLRRYWLWPGDGVMAAVTGAVLLAGRYRLAEPQRSRKVASDAADALFSGRVSPPRVLIGGGLALGGVFLLFGAGPLEEIGRAGESAGLVLAGTTIVFGPWLGRLREQLNLERRERIRSEERAAMAAHLHDSVLQTLALIQHNPNEPRRVVRLARQQERELRTWLYGGDRRALDGPDSLPGAAEQLAAEVEADHDVRVSVVVVGDHPLDNRARTLLGAVREATVNAAKHAGVDSIAVFIEVEPGQVSAFVRDRGRGFDPERVPSDRRGIADSIRARMERADGRVVLVTAPGEGTEVQLYMPVPAVA